MYRRADVSSASQTSLHPTSSILRPRATALIAYGSRCGRFTSAVACSSPMKSSFSGSHLSFRFSSMAMLHRWHELSSRWCVKTSETGSPRSAHAVEEVLHVARRRPALVELCDLAVEPVAGPCRVSVFDRLAGDLAAVDEDLALVPLEPDAVVGPVLHDDRRAVGELQLDAELRGRVVAVGQLRPCRRRTPTGLKFSGWSGSRPCLRSRSGRCLPRRCPTGRCRRGGRPSRSACRRSTRTTSGSCRGSAPWCTAPSAPGRATCPSRVPSGGSAVGNGPPLGPPPIEQVAVSVLPSRPLRTMATAVRNRLSLRCCVPTWKTRFVSFTALQISLPSSIVSVSGFSQ